MMWLFLYFWGWGILVLMKLIFSPWKSQWKEKLWKFPGAFGGLEWLVRVGPLLPLLLQAPLDLGLVTVTGGPGVLGWWSW